MTNDQEPQQNADNSRHSGNRDSRGSTPSTDPVADAGAGAQHPVAEVTELDQLDAAILSAIAARGGGPLLWTDIRAQLPGRYRPWQIVTALCRLKAAGRIDANKLGGATIVASAP